VKVGIESWTDSADMPFTIWPSEAGVSIETNCGSDVAVGISTRAPSFFPV